MRASGPPSDDRPQAQGRRLQQPRKCWACLRCGRRQQPGQTGAVSRRWRGDLLQRAAGGKGCRRTGRLTLPSTKGYTGHSTRHSASVCCSTRVNNSSRQRNQTKRAVPSAARRRDRINRSAQASTHPNPADAAAHDAQQDARSPAPRRPRAHVHAGRRGRQPVACRRCKPDRSALQLSRPQRDARVATGRRRRRLLERDGVAAGQVQAHGGGGDDVERRVDLRALVERKAQAPAEVEVVAFDRSG